MVADLTGEPWVCAFGRGMTAKERERPAPAEREPLAPAELWRQALDLAVDGKPSASYLSRCLHIGWKEADALLDRMARHGIVSEPDAIGRRNVLTRRKLWLVVSNDA